MVVVVVFWMKVPAPPEVPAPDTDEAAGVDEMSAVVAADLAAEVAWLVGAR